VPEVGREIVKEHKQQIGDYARAFQRRVLKTELNGFLNKFFRYAKD